MISIDVNALNDLAEVEKAIEKLSFVRDALKNKKDQDALASQEAWYHAFNPAPYLADAIRRFEEGKILTRFSDLAPEDLDEMNAGPAVWPKLVPFMDPQQAIHDDGIVCLIDGEKRKFLGRYVRTVHHMSWESYLDRFDLPADYPQVCKELLEQRRKAAIDRGFGKRHRDQEAKQHVQVAVPAVRRLFGRREAMPQVSVNVDINGSAVTAVTDTHSARQW